MNGEHAHPVFKFLRSNLPDVDKGILGLGGSIQVWTVWSLWRGSAHTSLHTQQALHG